jgi:hypothetical protein
MFGPRIRNVFRSRWHALFWSAGVLLTAYCSVPSPDDAGEENAGAKVAAKPAHKNPWAKDSAAN